MNCEHDFEAFPGSRERVFCRRCGIGRNSFAREARATPDRPTRRTRRETTTPPPPPSLFDQPPDPDADRAREILDEAGFESNVRAIVDGAEIDPDAADELVRQALAFGPSLDLDAFAQQVGALAEPAATRVPEGADPL